MNWKIVEILIEIGTEIVIVIATRIKGMNAMKSAKMLIGNLNQINAKNKWKSKRWVVLHMDFLVDGQISSFCPYHTEAMLLILIFNATQIHSVFVKLYFEFTKSWLLSCSNMAIAHFLTNSLKLQILASCNNLRREQDSEFAKFWPMALKI